MTSSPSHAQIQALASFRRRVRSYEIFSERLAAAHGATPAIYELLLVVKAADGVPDIKRVANALALRHHSAAELIKRADALGLVTRENDPGDARRVMVRLTATGEAALAHLATAHMAELRRTYQETMDVLIRLDGTDDSVAVAN